MYFSWLRYSSLLFFEYSSRDNFVFWENEDEKREKNKDEWSEEPVTDHTLIDIRFMVQRNRRIYNNLFPFWCFPTNFFSLSFVRKWLKAFTTAIFTWDRMKKNKNKIRNFFVHLFRCAWLINWRLRHLDSLNPFWMVCAQFHYPANGQFTGHGF